MLNTTIKNSQIWKIAYPIMLGNLAQTLIALVDTAFLGRIGEVELGAAAMAGIYYIFFTTLSWGFAIGVQVIVARRFGERNFGAIGVILRHGIFFMFLFSVCLFLLLHNATDLVMRSFVSSDAVYRVAVEFIDYRCYGIFFASFNFLLRSLYIGLSDTRPITYTTMLMTAVNVLFDSLLVFGTSFTPAMGVAGAALASVFAEISATIFFICYTLVRRPVGVSISLKGAIDFSLMRTILSISFPTMIQKFFSFGSWLVFFLIVEKIGERALAVTMVSRSVIMLLGIPVFALGATANTLTSRLIGEGRKEEVKPTLRKILRFSALCLIFPGALLALVPDWCLAVYTNSPEIIQQAVPIMYLGVFIQYAMAGGMIYFDAISGTGHTTHAMIVEILVLIAYVFVAWYFALGIRAGVFWVWTCELVYGVLLFLVCASYFRFYKWSAKKI